MELTGKRKIKPKAGAAKIPLQRLVIRKFGVPWDLCSFSGLCLTCGIVVPKGELYANDMAEHDIWRCKSCLTR